MGIWWGKVRGTAAVLYGLRAARAVIIFPNYQPGLKLRNESEMLRGFSLDCNLAVLCLYYCSCPSSLIGGKPRQGRVSGPLIAVGL